MNTLHGGISKMTVTSTPQSEFNNPSTEIEAIQVVPLKLFAFQPNGFGELSFFVIAQSEEQAKLAVMCDIAEKRYHHSQYSGFGTSYYQTTVAEIGKVITNENE